jgi:hypothetical protein
VDVVSSPLSVNTIPAGLGSLNAPQGNYPAFTFQAPVNPQNLNRYSYVINDPLLYTDPYGWWTQFLGVNVIVGCAWGLNFTLGIAWDDNGQIAAVVTSGGGAVAGATIGATGQYQWTNADTVNDLRGLSSQTGGSANIGPVSGGVEYVVGMDPDNSYQGFNVNVGVGLTAVAEMHSTVDTTEVQILLSNDDVDVAPSYEYSWDDYWWDDYYYNDYYYDDYWDDYSYYDDWYDYSYDYYWYDDYWW